MTIEESGNTSLLTVTEDDDAISNEALKAPMEDMDNTWAPMVAEAFICQFREIGNY